MKYSASGIYSNWSNSIANLIAVKNDARVGSGSGFLVNGKLVTCAHVVAIPAGVSLFVEFQNPSGNGECDMQFLGHSSEHSYDYAILEVPHLVNLGPSLELTDRIPVPGEPVCALGYPFDDPQLTIHQGIISAVYKSGVATMLKLDMSVNASNSGGPLISMLDGKVVGVVARKATGLTAAFDDLIKSFEANAQVLEKGSGGVFIAGISPNAMLAQTQRQMKHVSEQIKRSANVGIGYAISVDKLFQENALN